MEITLYSYVCKTHPTVVQGIAISPVFKGGHPLGKAQPIMFNFYLLYFWAMLKKFAYPVQYYAITTAIMLQFMYHFIIVMTRLA